MTFSRQIAVKDMFESPGTKLRRLAKQAGEVNVLINPPWLLPPAWMTSTNYYQGNVVAANGAWYVCLTGSAASPVVSASTGTGPNNQATATPISDGTAQWYCLGGPIFAAADPEAPSVTFNNSTTITGLTAWNTTIWQNFFRLYGGYYNTTAFAGGALQPAVCNTSASALMQPVGGRISFWTDAPKFILLSGFSGSGNSAFRVSIDGRWLSHNAFVNTSSSQNSYLTIDFLATSGRKPRLIEIETMPRLGQVFQFFKVYTTSNDEIWTPTTQDDVRIYHISDSYFGGSNYSPMCPGENIIQQVAKYLGWSDPWNASIGGTGYIATNSGVNYTYGQRVAEGLTRNPDIWSFMGSTNDNGLSAASITAAALACYQSIRAGGSIAPIIVWGVSPINSFVPTTEAAVQAAVAQFNDPKTFFIPISADPTWPWITGSWNNSTFNSSNNSAVMIASDNTHPTAMGVSYYGRRLSNAVRTNVLPFLN